MPTKIDTGIKAAVGRASLATLVAQVPLLVLDVSHSGCLLETQHPMELGRIGTIRLALNGAWYIEDVRVTRSVAVTGRGSTYHVGVEFLRTRRPADQSLRHAVGHLIGRPESSEREIRGSVRQR